MKLIAFSALALLPAAIMLRAEAADTPPRADECMSIVVIDAGNRALTKLAESNPGLETPDLAKWSSKITACKAMGAWIELPEPKTKDEYVKALTLGMMVATGYAEAKQCQAICLSNQR